MRPASSQPYAARLVVSVVVLASAIAFVYGRVRGSADAAPTAAAPSLESGDTFAVRDVALIRPVPALYERFAAEDRAWRAAEFREAERVRIAGGDVVWQPGRAQQLDDAVFLHASAGRIDEALALLRTWLEREPGDIARTRTAARLLAQRERWAEAHALWERALQLQPADASLRAEYARALSWSGQHGRAAIEWRRLAQAPGAPREWRVALAQSLAWGGDPGGAEPLLAALVRESPADTAMRTLLRATRASLSPPPAVAAGWVDEDPRWIPYRISLARALSSAGDARGAARAWTRVLADSVSVPLLVEAAGSAAAAGDSVGAAALAGQAVALAPADRALRERWASLLAWSGARRAAIAQLDTLIASRASGPLLLLRAQLHLAGDDGARALADAERSAALEPTYEAYALVGDLRRWRGEYTRARAAYARALELRPDDARVLEGIAAARSAEREALAARASLDERGWLLAARYAEDNAGYLMLAAGLSRAVRVCEGTALGLGFEQRRIAQRAAGRPTQWITGYAVDATAEHRMRSVDLRATIGVVRHALVRDAVTGEVSATLYRGPASLNLRAGVAPAYEQLWALRTLVDVAGAEGAVLQPLQARTVGARAAMPVGAVTVAVDVERTRLGDRNTRTSGALSVRVPLTRSLSAVYSGGTLAFGQPSSAYWTPERYTSHAAGVEYAMVPRAGVRVAARVLPGVGRSDERLQAAPGGSASGAWTRQLGAGADVVVDRSNWSVRLSGSYGDGSRGGGQAGYRSLAGTAAVRVSW